MGTPTSVSVGHGPGTPHNEGTAKDRGTPVPDSNLTEIEATQEPAKPESGQTVNASDKGKGGLLPSTKGDPAQAR
ncbi:hypothetical protein [Aquabacterium sp.]|uniref:hypothetical protein n=1 Tax=Aquabacterium sp. TaxID=1872578 RepID=UPI00199E7EB4|nr:hypothetical protein [Aquabacterium sp.]MBC7700345.1 hypothetical protein [Aquabacterium sp.]